ncbi:MAG: hypothetical protein ABSB69_01450 [Solirubrobacteraceae bacterium]
MQLLARAALALDAFARARAQLLHVGGEPVAHALELAEVQQRRTARDTGARHGRRDVREALDDDRRALALQSCYLRPQGDPGGALVRPQAIIPGGAGEPRAGTVVTQSVDRPPSLALPIDDLLLVLGHTRLLAGREQFYQRGCTW